MMMMMMIDCGGGEVMVDKSETIQRITDHTKEKKINGSNKHKTFQFVAKSREGIQNSPIKQEQSNVNDNERKFGLLLEKNFFFSKVLDPRSKCSDMKIKKRYCVWWSRSFWNFILNQKKKKYKIQIERKKNFCYLINIIIIIVVDWICLITYSSRKLDRIYLLEQQQGKTIVWGREGSQIRRDRDTGGFESLNFREIFFTFFFRNLNICFVLFWGRFEFLILLASNLFNQSVKCFETFKRKKNTDERNRKKKKK